MLQLNSGQNGYNVWRSLLRSFALNPQTVCLKTFAFVTGTLKLDSFNMIPQKTSNGIG
jgi:hypothetical protein